MQSQGKTWNNKRCSAFVQFLFFNCHTETTLATHSLQPNNKHCKHVFIAEQQPNIYLHQISMLVLSFMLSEMFSRPGQSCISKRSGQTNEIIAELVNYHHFHSLTTCNIYGIMVLDRFIVVFV